MASTSGGGVGSSRPRNEYVGVYDLLVGLTGLLGSIARNRALMFGAARVAFGAGVSRTGGTGVACISTGRAGAGELFAAAPGCGPGEGPPLGPGRGAVPGVRATDAVLVGLGFGTPGREAGASDARAAGAALARGAAVARATAAAVGEALGTVGAGVDARALGRALGAGGLGDGRVDGALVGTGDGAVVGGGFIATATGATVGTLTGAAGNC
ncbi:MAG: hypothetical protein JO104_10455 [Candidatus Eremiobacteraeota bacterium]|nr:hypothetical protein [Candidatus Eremiobacteraeota bacterium]